MDLLLFDIDGTLLRTEGAGREALDAAFLAVCGWPEATRGISLAGATDGGILRGVRARFDADPSAPFPLDALQAAYFAELEARVSLPGRVSVCPGAAELLEGLSGRAHLSLLTGNWRGGAERKLRAAGLDRAWIPGAYGDDAVDRNALVPVACARARASGVAFRRVVVIGDTPADVACARAGGAVAVAVETGFASRDALAAAGADLVLPDLLSGRAWLEALIAGPFEA